MSENLPSVFMRLRHTAFEGTYIANGGSDCVAVVIELRSTHSHSLGGGYIAMRQIAGRECEWEIQIRPF